MASNLDLVRSIHADWQRGEWSHAEWADPEIELVFSDAPGPGHWVGREAVALGWREFLATWDGYRIEAEEYRELDKERVLALVTLFGRGRTSGLELGETGAKGAVLFCVRDGMVRRLVGWSDRERAFADLGLSRAGDAA